MVAGDFVGERIVVDSRNTKTKIKKITTIENDATTRMPFSKVHSTQFVFPRLKGLCTFTLLTLGDW